MQTLRKKLIAAGYSEVRAQAAEANLIRIKSGDAPVNRDRCEKLGDVCDFLPPKAVEKRSYPSYRMGSLPVTQRCKPIIPTLTAFSPMKRDSVESIQMRYGINPPRCLDWREA